MADSPVGQGGDQAGSQPPEGGDQFDDSTLFELDLGEETPTGEGAVSGLPGIPPQSGVSGTPPAGEPATADAHIAQLEQRAIAAERRANEAHAAIQPFMHQLGQRLATEQDQVPTREFLLNDPSAATEHLLRYIDAQNQGSMNQAVQSVRMDAARIASEAQVRGRLNQDVLPDGWTYDQVIQNHCRPVYETNPAMRDVCAMLAPDNPAQMEYWMGVLLMMDKQAAGDPVKMAQMLAGGLNNQQGRQVLRQVNRAAQTGAQRIASAQATGRQVEGPKRTVGATEIQGMSDRDFDLLDQQLTGGL